MTIEDRADIGSTYIQYCRRRLTAEYLPRIRHCLNLLSDEDIWWRADETNNSIGNIILHLEGNIRQWIVSGLGGKADQRDRAREFAERQRLPREELTARIERVIQDADHVLAHFPADELMSVRHIQVYDVTSLDAISHVVEHLAQHLGQIIYITKLRTKTDLRFYDL